MPVRLLPITDDDAHRVACFLHEHLDPAVPFEDWTTSISPPWHIDQPNGGFMLLDGEVVVGAYLAYYSERRIGGRSERFCNLGSWCVLPEHRFQGLRLLRALLAQDGYTFTDFTPLEHVAELNRKLGFQQVDAQMLLVPNVPLPARGGRGLVSSDPAVIERLLSGEELRLYRDHAGAAAIRHVALARNDERCYVVLRPMRWANLASFMIVMHVSNPDMLRALAGPFARHLLIKHRALAHVAEERVLGRRPRLARRQRRPTRSMFRSERIRGHDIDWLYSELTCVRW